MRAGTCQLYISGMLFWAEVDPGDREVGHPSNSGPDGLWAGRRFGATVVVASKLGQKRNEFA